MFQNSPRSDPLEEMCVRHRVPLETLDFGAFTELEQGTWRVCRGDNVIVSTGGLGPCLGIGVYDPASKAAVCGHFTDTAIEGKVLDSFFDFVESLAAQSTGVKIGVGGLAPCPEADRTDRAAEELRAAVLERVRALNISEDDLTIEWSTNDICTAIDVVLSEERIDIAEFPSHTDLDVDF